VTSFAADARRIGRASADRPCPDTTLVDPDAIAVLVTELQEIIAHQAAALRLWESTAAQLYETIETLETHARLRSDGTPVR
jgi:hypothetical protein